MDSDEPSYVLDLKHVLGTSKTLSWLLAKVSLLSSEVLSGFIPLPRWVKGLGVSLSGHISCNRLWPPVVQP